MLSLITDSAIVDFVVLRSMGFVLKIRKCTLMAVEPHRCPCHRPRFLLRIRFSALRGYAYDILIPPSSLAGFYGLFDIALESNEDSYW